MTAENDLGGYAYFFGCGEAGGKQLASSGSSLPQLVRCGGSSPLPRRTLTCDRSRLVRKVSATILRLVTDTKQAKRFFVSGFVQGVGFRYFAENTAKRLGICGYVRNLRDGRVEAYGIGTAQQLANFKLALENGPSAANVMKVIEQADTIHEQYANSFSITYDA
jgi:acylphosphatase